MTSRSLLTALLVGCRLVRGLRCAAPRPARALCRLRGKTRGVEPAAELEEYWSKHGQKWARPLELLDVRAAWASGECDGILPSGRPSRDSQDRMISVVRAQELYDSDALSVRRRYRNAGAAELAPRWARVLEARAGLVEAGRWDAAVAESAKRRDFEGALLRGEVESPEASPAASRAVATALSPLLKLAASQRDRADGGALTCFAELQETAGDDDEERWLTAALLADFESEVAALQPRAKPRPTYSQQADAARDTEEGNAGFIQGAALAVVAIILQQLLTGGGGG
eukprot:CAMPEP_0119270292 /NCGR_PEP_ID=MMETSP1329-20130426/7354_1 /TAXON_ID=114041 /ORGANISM="Genus nov. species nov., Strain RCC1024" /LENGTH=284 /DNA_ID=CAMNT_0007270309 /DNA_START=147 /DNA_END=998 /DNA_ORIENTATION=+